MIQPVMTTVELSPTPLPLRPPPCDEWKRNRPNYLRAYDMALNAERHAHEQVEADPTNQEAKDHLTFARVAGYLLLEFFNRRTILSEIPCVSLVKRLISPPQGGDSLHDVIFGVGKWYFDHLLCTIRTRPDTQTYPTPESLQYLSPPFDSLAQMTREHMEADGKDLRTARRKALVRDGFRCMLTGLYDETSLERNSELHEECVRLRGMPILLEACHILGESTLRGIDPENDEEGDVRNKTEYAMATLIPLGLGDLAEEFLGADGIHDLGNILSFEFNVRTRFSALGLWFEGTQEVNHYNICVIHPGYEKDLRLYGALRDDGGRLSVTFTSNRKDARLPNPKLLALHAACARVVHMSGAAAAFRDLDRNADALDESECDSDALDESECDSDALDESECDSEYMSVFAFDDLSVRLPDHSVTPFATIPGVA